MGPVGLSKVFFSQPVKTVCVMVYSKKTDRRWRGQVRQASLAGRQAAPGFHSGAGHLRWPQTQTLSDRQLSLASFSPSLANPVYVLLGTVHCCDA